MSAFLFQLDYPAVAILKAGVKVPDDKGNPMARPGYVDLPTNSNGDQVVPLGRIAHSWLRRNAGLPPMPGASSHAHGSIQGTHPSQAAMDAAAIAKRKPRIHQVVVTKSQNLIGSDMVSVTFRVQSIAVAERASRGTSRVARCPGGGFFRRCVGFVPVCTAGS